MKRVDRLIIGELLGPWVFGVAIFTVLISAGQFLFEITRYIAAGADVWKTTQLLMLLMPGVMAKTFSMAVLLSALLAFGRLSGDSEIVAMRAGGISVSRIMRPVALFGLGVFAIALVFSEIIVPPATYRAVEIRIDIDSQLQGQSEQSTSRAIYEDGKIKMMLKAKNFDMHARSLDGVILTVFDGQGEPELVLYAEEMVFTSAEEWSMPSGWKLVFFDSGITMQSADKTFPSEVPNPDVTPDDLVTQALKELEAFSMKDMKKQIDREKQNPNYDRKMVSNLEFGYWNKLALPLAALVFGLVGAPLGIRNHRAGTATGFALSVVIIFGYMMLANAMSIMAQGGRIPAFVASFTPIVIGLVVAMVFIHLRNR